MSLVASNVHISIPLFLPPPTSKNCKRLKTLCGRSVNDHALQSFKVLFQWRNKFLSICQPVVTRSQTGKIDAFFRNLDSHNTRRNLKHLFYIIFQVLKRLLMKGYKISYQFFYFLLFYISFYISMYQFLQLFRTFFKSISEKSFLSRIYHF